MNTEELELIGKHLSVFAHAWPPKKCSSKWRGNCLCATNPDLAMEPSAAGVAAPDTFVMVGPPTAELERGWPWPRPLTPRVTETREINLTAKILYHVEENQHVITWQALKLSGGDGVSVSASTQSSPTEREKPGEAPQITISIKTTSTRKRKIDGPEDKGSTSASAVLVPQTPWPCARCNLEPVDTVWRPLDGATLFDTEERICGACWLVEDDQGAGRGDTEDLWM